MEDHMKKKGGFVVRLLRFSCVWLLFFFLPTQLAKHFWPDWAYIFGIRSDYLAPTLSFIDVLMLCLLALHCIDIVRCVRVCRYWWIVALVLTLHIVTSIQPLHTTYLLVKLSLYGLILKAIVDRFDEYKTLIITALTLGTIQQLILVLLQMYSQSSLQGLWYWLGERTIVASLPDVAKIYIHGTEYMRPYGTFSHPNSLGGFYLLLFFLARLWKNQRYGAMFTFLSNTIQACSLIFIIVSFSKTAIFSFMIVCVGLLVGSLRDVSRRSWVAVQIVLLVLVFLPFFTFTSDYFSLSKRITLVENSFYVIAQHPFFGVGLGNYVIAQSKLADAFTLASVYQPVHNVVLLFFAEAGLLGVMAGYILLRKQIRKLLTRWSSCWSIFVSVMLTGMMDHYWLTLPQNMLLLFFALMLITSKTEENPQNTSMVK